MADENTPKPDPKWSARFFARSAARLERLLIINAPLPIVQSEIQTARNRLTELEAAYGVTRPDGQTFSQDTPLVSGDSEANKEKGESS